MSNIDFARALRDQNYFNSLSEDEKAEVRAVDPAGEVALSDSDLEEVAGGQTVITGTGTGQTCNCTASRTGTGGGTCVCCETPPNTPAPLPLPDPGGPVLA